MIDAREKAIIAALQEDFPVQSRPYAGIAAKVGMSEEELLECIRSFQQRGYIRKIGAVLRHRKVGFTENAMCVWRVPEDQVESIGHAFAAAAFVSHCYARPALPAWPYNVYTMLHGTSAGQCEMYARQLAECSGIEDYLLLNSLRELKKTTMRYFEEEDGDLTAKDAKDAKGNDKWPF